jgi:hypothetical protein
MQSTMDSNNKRPVRVVIDSLGHPLTLLFLGGLLTYIIAPIVVGKINERKLLQETKQKKAMEIWSHNTEFNSKLNALKTQLQSYHSQNVRLQLDPPELKEAQKEFRRDFNRRYLELDEMAWWWYRTVQREANSSALVPRNQLPRVNADLDKYGENVNTSIGLLRPMWRALTSRDYHPDDQKTKTDFEALQKAADQQMPALFEERSRIIEEVADIITTPP